MAENVAETEEEAVELILTVVAVLAVVVWEITKKACGTKVDRVKGTVEEPSQEKPLPSRSRKARANSQDEDLVVVRHARVKRSLGH